MQTLDIKMQLILIISILTSISAIRVPSVWQQQPNQNTNVNNVNKDLPTHQGEPLPQTVPTYNDINAFINNVPNTATNGLISNRNVPQNLPVNPNNWFTLQIPNNGLVFSNPTQQGKNINQLSNGNEIRQQNFIQQQPIPSSVVQNQRNFIKKPITITNTESAARGQVPYITYTYTTQGSVSPTTPINSPTLIQTSGRSVNIKQAYPQVTSPKSVIPLKELDFNPLNPFPQGQQDVQASTQINNPNYILNTPPPIRTYDFNLNNPFPHSSIINGYEVPQPRLVPKKLFTPVTENRNQAGFLRNVELNPFIKNYRDHRTHEPTGFDPHFDTVPVPAVERLESEKAPVSQYHEYPAEIPTKPIYPGEGQWAKPGYKHRPFISKQQYGELDESQKPPDGYDTFLEGQQLFENQKRDFGQKLSQLPSQINSEDKTEKIELFVPTRLYAQVRHSEDEKHLPPESDENGRLKELVKDTKIQTIYSEEGFEDSAYDHAGHEKKAENTEGYQSDEKKKDVTAKKKIPLKKYDRETTSYSMGDQNLKEEDLEKLKNDLNVDNDEDVEDKDSEPAGTHYDQQSYLNKIPDETKGKSKKFDSNAFVKSKEVKTVTAKNKGGGNIEMEISSEVKAIVQPNNSTKFHKYVKIYPKLNKNIKLTEIQNGTLVQEPQTTINAGKGSLPLDPNKIFIEEILNQTSVVEQISTTVTPIDEEIVTMEIPTTTQATTSIPKVEQNTQVEISDKPKASERRRRSAEIPNIKVDTDFIDNINHDLGKPTEKTKVPIENKYPYYKSYQEKGVNENSPLRYSEHIKNVPVKTEGKLAFYDLADRKMACPDVNPEVDPVPDRIKNADEGVEDEEEDEEGNDPATKEPRLGQLGDKIDCFKYKYFGEDPLDNPIFKEESIGSVKPIFSEIEKLSTKELGVQDSTDSPISKNTINRKTRELLHESASNYETENEISDNKAHKKSLISWFPGKNFGMGENTERDSKFVNHFVDRNPHLKVNTESQQTKRNNGKIKPQPSNGLGKEVQTPPTLITTPKYTISLKPKHIYDQIQLLEYLPDDAFDEVKKAISEDLPKMNKTEVTTSLPNSGKMETVLNSPQINKKKKNQKGKQKSQRRGKVLKINEDSMKMETSDNNKPESLPEMDALQLVRIRPKKPQYEIFDINKYLPKVPKIPFPTQTAKRYSDSNYLAPVSIRNPTYEVFDINKYLPTTPFPLFRDFITHSTVLPKYKVISEVFYKDDIKPNEQLNVFTDVLKHIRSFPKLKDSFPQSSEPISVKLSTNKALEKYPADISDEDSKDYFSSTITTVTTTFDPKMYASNHKYTHVEDTINPEKQVEDMLNSRKTTRKPKRRRRIKTTTQETPMVIEESSSTIQYTLEPTEVMGLIPPIIQGYKTIYHPKRDNSQHIGSPTTTTIRIEEMKINKYFVKGMRPPPKQKVYLYSDFLTDNGIVRRMNKPKRSKLRRSRRSAQRPSYAQVQRNRNKQQPEAEPEVKKEEDDYVPHRPKNYHYDEKTGKIVYDKKPPEQSEGDEEVEYIEVVEQTPKTTDKPKQNPIFATATPPPDGQSYTDFVKLLKSASNYHEIPDPTTTEKGAEEVTQKMVASTLQSVSTSPPEFLSILAKVRNDTTYKLIEDKKDNKKNTTSTQLNKSTQKDEGEETASSVEESEGDDIKNSPSGQNYESGANLEIFDISDFLPNIKSYLPKTSIDTSKYKTIERPNPRHSISSRYNSETDPNLQNARTSKRPILTKTEATEHKENSESDQNLQNAKTSKRPILNNTKATEDKDKVHIESNPNDYKTTTTAPETSSPKILRPVRRRTTTTESSVEVQNNADRTLQENAPVQNDKARRNYRRRPARIKTTPTTESILEAGADNTTKIVRRRSEDSQMYAEGNEQYEQFIETDGSAPVQSTQTEDYVEYDEISNNTESKQLDNLSLVAKKLVDVFKRYNKDQQHGGNYKKQEEVAAQAVVASGPAVPEKPPAEVFKAYDKSKQHGGDYEGEKEEIKSGEHEKPVTRLEPINKKQVEIIKDYDKTKKHGGNYRAITNNTLKNEQDEPGLEKNESIQIKSVNVFQNYDKTKKHGGNYKVENDALDRQAIFTEPEPDLLLKNIEVFKDYDKSKKHGGNYRSENRRVVEEQELGETQISSPQVKNILVDQVDKKSSVEVFKEYDKKKKHGGNYMRENETTGKEVVAGSAKDVEILKKYDIEQKAGGSYRREEEAEPIADEIHFAKTNTPHKKRFVESKNNIQRLTDVVLKPEAFYSDVKLPLDINALKIVKNLSHEELEEIVKSAEDADDDKKKLGETFRRHDQVAHVVNIVNRPRNPLDVQKIVTSTKKPIFIKDPSKRLYYYAPIR